MIETIETTNEYGLLYTFQRETDNSGKWISDNKITILLGSNSEILVPFFEDND